MLTFESLTVRLIERLRWKIRCGEWTERSLARRAGISQPHLHNVMKGERELSPGAADRLLHAAGLSLLDLLDEREGDDARTRAIIRDGAAPAPRDTPRRPGGPFHPN